jgi:magnesium-transporting ATPase (P-type)
MNAREKRTIERKWTREKREREREIMEWVGERTHHYRLHILEKSRAIRTYAYIHCAVANFLLHFNVWSYQTAHTSIYIHTPIYFARLTIICIMIVFIIAVFFLQFIFPLTTTANDISNNRYNSLISAQCKARCLYEYRHHHHQQQRSVPAIFNNGKTKRLLVRR